MATNDLFNQSDTHGDVFSSPQDRRPRKRVKQQRQHGATIGDGIRSSARIAATMTGIALLIKAGPMLLAGVAGCVFVIRGCMSTPTPLPHFDGKAQSTEQSPPSTVMQMPSVERNRASAKQQQVTARAVYTAPIRGETIPETPAVHPAPTEPDWQYFTEPAPTAAPTITWQPSSFPSFVIPLNQPFPGAPAPNAFGGLHSTGPSSSAPSVDPVSSPLFDVSKGRKFLGTSQQPGSPSVRISLSLDAIQERGRNLKARLSTLQGTRITKSFTGLIEQNPLRLVLIPETNPTSFGTFVTYQPWHSNSPTRITLEIASDGKLLTGTSGSGEQFELMPDAEREAPALVVPKIAVPFNGFDEEGASGTVWKLVNKNGNPVDDQTWEFTQLVSGHGEFRWMRGATVIAQGNYRDANDVQHLDITVTIGAKSHVYPGRYTVRDTSQGVIRVCLPAEANSKRPKGVSSTYGNIFELSSNPGVTGDAP